MATAPPLFGAAVTVVGSVLALGGVRLRTDAQGGDLRLEHDLVAAGTARRAVTADLRDRGVDEELVAEVAVVLSELVANSVRHARPLADGTVRVRWQHDDEEVHVQVTDGCGPGGRPTPGPVPPDVPAVAELATGGRGLRIVTGLADAWGSSRDAAGRCTVWAVLSGERERRSA